MLFEDFPKHKDAAISARLLWEFDIKKVDYQEMRNIIVTRVIQLGDMPDWYAMLNLYGVEAVKEIVRNKIAYLNDKDMKFVSGVFDIPLTEMKCYIKKQSQATHWDA